MCGIVGCNFQSAAPFEKVVEQLHRRGPDFSSFKQVEQNFFGHTRLSIIDLNEEANQPMIFDDIIIVFNGEIYNYKELTKEEQLHCQTASDTEVIIRLYQKYQEDFLNKLNGMFAFCIYDIKQQKYFCARDRYGKKPLFYCFKEGKFIFSSMIKPIITLLGTTPKLNKVALSQYLQYFVPIEDNTFFSDIKKLEAGSFMVLEKGELKSKKYYKINTYKKTKSEPQALKDIEELLFKSVEARLTSDVEVGSLLSGGIDSSLISALYTNISGRKINTFSVGYSDYKAYSELPYAQITAKHIGSNHHALEISQKEFIESFDTVMNHLEEPHADSAAVPLYLLTKEIHKTGIKTVLSGEGSDELFLGYDNYAKFLKYYAFEKSLSSEQSAFMDSIITALQNNTKESEYLRRVIKQKNLYNSFGEIFTDIQKKRLFKKVPHYKSEKAKKDPVDWMSYIDLKIWLGQGLLSKVDKMSMANSLEVRTPFLDYRLVDYMFGVDSCLKIGNTNKYLLKQIAQKYIPQEIIQRTKKGFNSPFNEWIFGHFGNKILELILEVNEQTGFFNAQYVTHLFELAKNRKFKQHLWSLFVFSWWFKKNYM
ncbi:asparagine synthase (glutamine-hydrolyzing) [Candidatus Marinarcus aquaticus]|uniref:asparagine synthase (glutamine-hydrolyzing) n=1 Tax=Candidatus Marinarcus aquaticus TaxID=2044504 RepID=A0A4Q0XSE1_9BACT|nr:asparagine synthase (glutamine-hydrolyzing) [Candidatus Marinarcus aquaticus]RXJ58007.1 asparagine synthase (glutamine-hydrolyzing) [Candidatus Marinarcus aquaticus]